MLGVLIALLAISVLSLGDMNLNAVSVTSLLPRIPFLFPISKTHTISTNIID